MTVRISKSARSYPKLPYAEMANAVLGASYELSLTFVGATRAQKLNETYRGKLYTPNILSFPLTKAAGEIYICPSVAKREAPKFKKHYAGYVGFLFIHGLLHLKGHLHGDTMEKAEEKYCKRFNLK